MLNSHLALRCASKQVGESQQSTTCHSDNETQAVVTDLLNDDGLKAYLLAYHLLLYCTGFELPDEQQNGNMCTVRPKG
jgi:hypothetical protein